jgi:hypothetical protein
MLEPIREVDVDLNLSSPTQSSYTVVKDIDVFTTGMQAYNYTYDNAKITVKFVCTSMTPTMYEIGYDVTPIDPEGPLFSVPWDSDVIFKLVVAAVDYVNRRDTVTGMFYNTPSQSKHNVYQYYAGLWGMLLSNQTEITEP